MTYDQNTLQRFLDESSIRNTIARFADSATRFDYELFRSVWAPDGEFIIGKPPQLRSATGSEDIVAMLKSLRAGKDFFIQFALPGVIDIDGDQATTRTFCHESARGPGRTYYRNHSVSFDRLVRLKEGWVFASRSFQYLWLDTTPFTGDAFPLFS